MAGYGTGFTQGLGAGSNMMANALQAYETGSRKREEDENRKKAKALAKSLKDKDGDLDSQMIEVAKYKVETGDVKGAFDIIQQGLAQFKGLPREEVESTIMASKWAPYYAYAEKMDADSPEPFTLSPGQERFATDPSGATQSIASVPKTQVMSPGQELVQTGGQIQPGATPGDIAQSLYKAPKPAEPEPLTWSNRKMIQSELAEIPSKIAHINSDGVIDESFMEGINPQFQAVLGMFAGKKMSESDKMDAIESLKRYEVWLKQQVPEQDKPEALKVPTPEDLLRYKEMYNGNPDKMRQAMTAEGYDLSVKGKR